jgi:shikimate dehydrogenase
LFHNARFARSGLNAVYVNFLVEDLAGFLASFGDLISGLSVTMPFKEQIIPHLDSVSEEASTLRSVNTVLRKRGKLLGFNTDYPAVRSILRNGRSMRGRRALVLGTGPTSRSMALAAIESGASATIVGRSRAKAEDAARRLACSWASFGDLADLGADILMNGTPVGMAPDVSSSPYSKRWLRRGMTVLDAVYDPPLTLLLRDAKARGCTVISGLELFRHQALLQSKMFTDGVFRK